MNKIASTTVKSSIKNLISLSELKSYRNTSSPVLTVEINKQPSVLFTNSLWVGYRNGGMASWLSTLMPHLPHQKFCLYMDEDSYRGNQYMFSYYSQYFEKLFHNQYVGTCIHPRRLLNQRELTNLNEIKAKDLQRKLLNRNSNTPTVLLDLRGSDAATKCQMNKIAHSYQNCEYINLPLNDEDLIDTLQIKTNHIVKGTNIITLCQKGYRSLIGYSFLNLIKKHEWDIQLCRDPINQIKQQLTRPTQAKVKDLSSFGITYKPASSFAFI